MNLWIKAIVHSNMKPAIKDEILAALTEYARMSDTKKPNKKPLEVASEPELDLEDPLD